MLFAFQVFLLQGLYAQPEDKVTFPTIQSGAGREAGLPIYLNNTSEIVAVQFTLNFPKGFSISDTTLLVLSDRKVNHTVSVKNLGNHDFLFVIFSANNTPLRGNSGLLLQIPVVVPDTCTEGTLHKFVFKQLILSNKNGENVTTSAEPGAIEIIVSPRPDVAVQQINFTQQQLAPGANINVSWQVVNKGDLSTSSGWSEQVFLVGDNGESALLGTVFYTQLLSPSEIVSRQAEFTLSQTPGIDGPAKVQVKLIPNKNLGELPAAQHNNIAKSENYVDVSKLLILKLNRNRIVENNTSSIQCQLFRSGSRAIEQTFTVTTNNAARLEVPAEVKINTGSSGTVFYIKAIDNQVLNIDSIVTITVAGSNYGDVTETIIMEDNEQPELKVTPSDFELQEGDAFTLTIERSLVNELDLKVRLTCDFPKRFSFPTEVIIPANQKSVEVPVDVVNDVIPYFSIAAVWSAEASGYKKGTASVVLDDNDVPAISLTIAPTTISESAGYQATVGTVRREGATDNVLYVRMSDNAGGTLYYSTSTITLEKGVSEKKFTIGVVDNAQVEGTREYDVTAAVYISTCNCTVPNEGLGSVKTKLTVVDDDGPALKIASSQTMLPEGKSDATILTITRNTPTGSPLPIVISSDKDAKLVYTKNLVIPAGSSSVTTPVSVLLNELSEGDQTVTFTATADGFTNGFCWAMISDQTLADATISIVSLSKDTLETKDTLQMVLRIENAGIAPLTYGKDVDVYLSKEPRLGTSKVKIADGLTARTIQPGKQDTMILKFKLPDVTGLRYVLAEINAEQNQKELSYLNNVSENKPLVLLPKYVVSLQVNKSVYQSGETVVLTGTAKTQGNVAIPNAAVEIYLINNGFRQTLTATTDGNGAFTANFEPTAAQMGKFIAGACYPGQELTTEQAAFEILGMRRTSSGYLIWEVLTNIPTSGEIELINPGTAVLAGLSAQFKNPVPGVNVVFDPIADVPAGQKFKLKYIVTGTVASTLPDYDKLSVEVKSASGASIEMLIYYYCRDPKASLKANYSSIQSTMTKGTTRSYEFVITNNGVGESGNISVIIPSTPWLSMLTPSTIPSLKNGESTTVILQFSPGNDMAVNVPVTGTIGVNCENGSGFSLPFNIETVSESTGKLVIDVCDEYTYYTSESPHVAGATVKLKHPYTKALIMQGVTGSDGLFVVDSLPEGYYYVEITADKHDGYANNLLVDPGKTTKQVINLSFQAITITWDVIETEVVDEYSIETVVKFETNVPTPVVEMTFPREIDTESMLVGESQIFNIILTNKGLITAKDVEVIMPKGFTTLTFEPMFNFIDLKPQESVRIPVTLTKVGSPTGSPAGGPARVVASSSEPCKDYIVLIYFWDCGLDRKWHQYPQEINLGKWCIGTPSTGTGWSPGGYTIRPGGGGTGYYYPPSSNDYTPTVSVEGCEPCQNQYVYKMAKCLVKRIPIVSKTLEVIEKLVCLKNVVVDGDLECVLEGYIKSFEWVEKITGYKDLYDDCIKWMLEPCVPGDFGLKAPGENRVVQNEMPAYIQKYQEVLGHVNNMANSMEEHHMEVFGDSVWLNITGGELGIFWNKLWTYPDTIPANADLIEFKPDSISAFQYQQFVRRWNNTRKKFTGDGNYIDYGKLNQITARKQAALDYAKALGYSSVLEMFEKEQQIYDEMAAEKSASVCATITIKFSQTMTLTRQAFRGTLTVFNGHETLPMEDVKLNLVIEDNEGNIAGSSLFQTNTESLDKLTEINGTGTLNAQETGTAVILFIPTKNAAPEVPKDYSFGGSLSYKDPFTGTMVTRELFPVTLTVKPSPDLYLSYFMQRDVLGDDPLTKEIVEPSEDAEFSLLINNKGAGEATNVKIASKQPEIVENEKGLLITFEITGSSLNGAEKNMGITNIDFGNIPAGQSAYGQWYLRSSLLGHFVEYDVTYTHVTSFGNPDLSLVSDVDIHELIKSIDVQKSDVMLRGFLSNDVVDSYDYPDMLYLSDGTQMEVATDAITGLVKVSDTKYRLTVAPLKTGWNYDVLNDPGNGKLKLLNVLREKDNVTLPVRNVWQTDRTLRDGKDPLNEFKIHFADEVLNQTETYLLTFEAKRENAPAVVSFTGAPVEVSDSSINKIRVQFNVPIDPESFTTADMQLNRQGVACDLSQVKIVQLTDREFELNLSSVTTGSGYYVLTVQTHGILDLEGYPGEFGKTVSWIQFLDDFVVIHTAVVPEGSGTVSPTTTEFAYGTMVKFTATPKSGFTFKNWSEAGKIISGETILNYVPTENKTLTANFEKVKCNVNILYDALRGAVTGNSNGIYDLGTTLHLTALPGDKFIFKGWMINGTLQGTENILQLVIDKNLSIEAVFIPKDDTGLDVNYESGDLAMRIYPNPSKNGWGVNVVLEVPESKQQEGRLLIYSLVGVLERDLPLTQEEVHIADLKPGMYIFCLMMDDKNKIRQKVVVE